MQANSNLGYAAPLTKTVLLGTIAIRARKPIEWDGQNMQITNVPEANKYLPADYREGFSL